MKVAVIGSGVSGLAAADALKGSAAVTLFEAGDCWGGHANTVEVTLPDASGRAVTHGVDTGFLVYNERTYPNLIALFERLGVETAKSDMSFSVQVPRPGGALEWSGSTLATLFAQKRNLFNPRFLGMLADLLRFNSLCTRLAREGRDAELMQPLGDFLDANRFGAAFRDWYFLPMLGCIWSCPTDQMLRFPVATMIRFCHNHGLIQVSQRPQWYTVAGGSRRYVEKLVAGIPDRRLSTPVRLIERDEAGVRIVTDRSAERFDRVVIAAHSDQALALLRDASPVERELLGAIRYQPNRAVLHRDKTMLPRRRKAWAAWNYERAADGRESARVCLHYWINQLQPLPFAEDVIVSLNPVREIARDRILGEYEYAHPVFDLEAIRAQQRLGEIQGQSHTWFCGAWTGYGFHEDGLKSGLAAARGLLERR